MRIPGLLSVLSLKYPEQILKSCMCSVVWVWCKILTVKWNQQFRSLFRNKRWKGTSPWLNTNNKLPAKQKPLRADSYHQAVAERSCRYRVIEGFQSLGRITGFEMIARFNRPLKLKSIHRLRERESPLPLPLTCCCPPTDLLTFILNWPLLSLPEQKPSYPFFELKLQNPQTNSPTLSTLKNLCTVKIE